MTATGHAVIGVLIAAKISNPFIAVPIAVASHILADLYPHWDAGTHGRKKTKKRLIKEAAADVIIGFLISYALIFYLFPETNYTYAFIMILASQSLDWISAPNYFFGSQFLPFVWLYEFQHRHNTKLDKPWGIISQLVLVLLLIYLAIIL